MSVPVSMCMFIRYLRIVTLWCNFMLLIVGCRAMVPVYCWCRDDTVLSYGYLLLQFSDNILWLLGFPFCTFDFLWKYSCTQYPTCVLLGSLFIGYNYGFCFFYMPLGLAYAYLMVHPWRIMFYWFYGWLLCYSMYSTNGI